MWRWETPVPPTTFMMLAAFGGVPPMLNIIAAIVRVGLVGAVRRAPPCDAQSIGLGLSGVAGSSCGSARSSPQAPEKATTRTARRKVTRFGRGMVLRGV